MGQLENKIIWDYDYMLFKGITTSDYYKNNIDNPNIDLPSHLDEILSQIQSLDDITLQPLLWQRKKVVRVLSIKDDNKQYHRHKFYSTYKENRKPKSITPNIILQTKVKQCIDVIKDCLIKDTKFSYEKGLEADDYCGINSLLSDTVLGQDKDLHTIPNIVLWNTYNDTTQFVTEKDATYFTQYQMVVGDSSDGYPGIPGIGHAKYSTYFGNLALPWDEYIKIYIALCRECKKNEATRRFPYAWMVTMYRLAHMLTKEEYCFDTKKITYHYPFNHEDEWGISAIK